MAIVVSAATGCAALDDVRATDPCPDTHLTSIGEPENIDNSYATIEVVGGPVWLTVTEWEPGSAAGSPLTAPFFVGPMETPPDEPDAAVAVLAEHVVDVVDGAFTRLDLEPGVHWILTNAIVGGAAVTACDGGELGEVVPSP